jgi:putative hydrolase of HD superfamily
MTANPERHFMLLALVEIQRLKTLERTGWMLRGLPAGMESVAAHSYGVAVAAMFLGDAARARGASVDMELLLRMALLHDVAETRLGDLPRTASQYFGKAARHEAEKAAFADVMRGVESGLAEKYAALHEAYEKRENTESRLVKAADVIDLLIQVLAFERAGARGLDEFWAGAAEQDFRLDSPAREIVGELMAALLMARREILAKV